MVDQLATEFRLFTRAHSELCRAAERNDWDAAQAALEEIEAIEMHTAWSRLRARCVQVQREFARSKPAAVAEPPVFEITDDTDSEELEKMLAQLRRAAG